MGMSVLIRETEKPPHPFDLQLIPSAHFMPGTELGTGVSEIKKDTAF